MWDWLYVSEMSTGWIARLGLAIQPSSLGCTRGSPDFLTASPPLFCLRSIPCMIHHPTRINLPCPGEPGREQCSKAPTYGSVSGFGVMFHYYGPTN